MKKIQILCLLLLILSAMTGLVGCKKERSALSINGVMIEEYAIVYSAQDTDYSERAAKYLQSEIKERTGWSLPLVLDSDRPVSDYEIVVGETSRDISTRLNEECEGVSFAVLCEEKQIALEGDYFVIAAAAYYFVETYVPVGGGEETVPLGVSVHTPIVKEANSFILLIGDGMGEYQSKLYEYLDNTSDYSDGEDVFYGYMLPYRGTARTDSLSGITDSAAAGTALSTATKTENAYVGQLVDGTTLLSVSELSLSLGKGAGVMSTEGPTGATPSAFSAHTSDRSNTSEIIDDQFYFQYTLGGTMKCGLNQYTKLGIKTLESAIVSTLDTLDDGDGFFLMYEEAYVDKFSHDNDMDNAYLAIIRFNQAIGRFMEYAFYHPDTMIVITADHETGGLFPDADGKLAYSTTDHTGTPVPVFAYGYGAECFDGIEIENTQIPMTIAKFMGVDDFGDQSEHSPLN